MSEMKPKTKTPGTIKNKIGNLGKRQKKNPTKPESSRSGKGLGKKKTLLLALLLVLLCIIAVAIGVYLYYGYRHKDEFFKGTSINGMDVSGKTVRDVETILSDSTKTYSISVTSKDGQTENIQAADIDYCYVSDGSIQKIFDEQVWWQWGKSYLTSKQGEYETSVAITYDKEKLRSIMNSWSFMAKENQIAPVDSTLAYEEGQYVVTEHVDGNTIDETVLFDALTAAIDNTEKTLSVEEADAYIMPTVTKTDAVLNDNAKTLNEQTNFTITHNMPDGTTKVIDKDVLLSWMSTDETGRYYRDEAVFNEKIAAYVQELSAAVDACNGSNVTFTSSNSGNPRQVTIRSYISGSWAVNTEEETTQLTSEIMSNTSASREPIYSSRRFSGSGPLGDTYVEIDLSAQHLWYYQGGTAVLETDIVSGTYTNASRRTPEGVYSLDYKQRNRVLRGQQIQETVDVQVPVEVTVPGTDPVLDESGNVITPGTPPTTKIEYKTEQRTETKYEYECPVDYWMPFNGGIGLHDAAWRGSFGGSIYMYSGSHGCINMPHSKAGELFEMIEKGCPVVCYY